MDHRVPIVFLLLCSSGLWAEDSHNSIVVPDDVRLVGGASHCAGNLEEKHLGDWKPVVDMFHDWNLTLAAVVCRQLNCGSVVSLRRIQTSSTHPLLSNLEKLVEVGPTEDNLEISCSDSVRLVDGTSQCSGRLEVKSNQLWSPVCEDDFNQRGAEVVCRELGCGAPSVLQGAPYGEVEAPVWTKTFRCEGRESALLDCDSSVRNTCSSGKAVSLTCSEPGDIRLVGGASRCSGTLEINRRAKWIPVDERDWNLKLADAVCRQLDCGSAVSTTRRRKLSPRYKLGIRSDCKPSSLMKCFTIPKDSSAVLEITCSDSVRLVDGTSQCSGRLEVKSNQLWSSVCGDDFNQRAAQVVCRELGCGAPSVLQGASYGEVEAPVWTKTFRCKGRESALLDCDSSVRNTCSSGKAVLLTCSDPDDLRLTGGASRCTGTLELKHSKEWRAVIPVDYDWVLEVTAVICQWLDCGTPVLTVKKRAPSEQSVWWIRSSCVRSTSTLKECVTTRDELSYPTLQITCSDSVRLVNGTSQCSGRLVMKSNQLWSPVCEDDFNQQEAEVVCRELGCGAPSVLQGAPYGEVSALLDCRGPCSTRNTCSHGKAVALTCSDPDNIRLVGEPSRCAGTLEMKMQAEWRPVAEWDSKWDEKSAAAVCRLLDCGSAVSTKITDDSLDRLVWWVQHSCVQSVSSLLGCVMLDNEFDTFSGLEVICSDLLAQPNISSYFTDGVSKARQQGPQVLMGSSFTITCSVEPQYPGGSFQLISPASSAAHSYILPAVNHSAHFLFSAADHTHRGNYACIYHVNVFSHNFSSESQPLYVVVSVSLTELIIRLVVLLLGVMSLIAVLCFHSKASSIQTPRREKNTEINDYVVVGSKA